MCRDWRPSRPRHTMRQIAAASHLVCTAAATSRLRLVTAICRTNSNQFQNLCDRSQRQWFSHVTRGDLLQQPVAATCRSDLSHRVSRPSNYAELGHFTLFCRGRQRNVQRFITHVHSYYFAHETFCLPTFSLKFRLSHLRNAVVVARLSTKLGFN